LAATAGTALIAALGAVVIVVLTGVSFGGLAEVRDPSGHDLQIGEIESGAFGGDRRCGGLRLLGRLRCSFG
jgi:hypothetical protein